MSWPSVFISCPLLKLGFLPPTETGALSPPMITFQRSDSQVLRKTFLDYRTFTSQTDREKNVQLQVFQMKCCEKREVRGL